MKTQLVWIALGHKAVSLLILFVSGYLPDFDQSSPYTYSRWDTLHYSAISKHGYSFEHQWAFFPGVPFLSALFPSQLTAGIAFGLFSIPSTTALYDLSLHVLKSPSKAYLAALLSIFTSSPAVVHVSGCPEPLFTFCTYRGLLECARKRWYAAALLFMIAGTLRSNGILLAGFHPWYLLIHPLFATRKIPFQNAIPCVTSVALILLPFITHNYTAWIFFCRGPDTSPWCSSTIPLAYSYIQSRYWNVGPFRYWTIAQSPNFLLCLPIILLLMWSCSTQLWHQVSSLVISRPDRKKWQLQGPEFYDEDLIPHAIHAFVFTSWIIIAAHTQILLRQAPSLPFLYWSATRLLIEYPQLGKCWIYWSVIWGVASLVLWGTFLPPA